MKTSLLGDTGLIVYCDGEMHALRFAAAIREARPAWLLDVVQAYTAVAIYFEPDAIRTQQVIANLEGLDHSAAGVRAEQRLHRIPCCYELGLDLERIAQHTGLGIERIIELHTGTIYTVYAIGFCPGFPYLGYLPEALAGVPRLPSPRLRVEAGSVGLTGRQTGIYAEARPGGWNIVGRTPLTLVDVAENYFPLRTGDQVQFVRIDEGEFRRSSGRRLE
jgi:inhibitor of KinA